MNKFKKFIDLDFETRSEAKIKDVGAWVYAEHPSTEVLILRYSIEGEKTKRWLIGDPPPRKLFRLLKRGYVIRAHNSFFEYCIWNLCAAKKLNWPEIPIEQFTCTQAISTAHAFQPSLENAAEGMELPVKKDKEGTRLIGMFSKPSRKKSEGLFKEPANYWQDFLRFDEYCKYDVLTQQAIVDYLPLLTPQQHEVFMLTETMNVRGIPIDVDMVEGAVNLIKFAGERANAEIKKITRGVVEKVSQREVIKNWLADNGLKLPNLQAQTLERALKKYKGKVKRKVYRVLELRAINSKTSTAKYKAALDKLGLDNCVHEALKYHIAKTGRWGGRGLQAQNFARPTLPKWVDYDYIAELIAEEDYEHIELLYGDLMEVLSSALRSMIKAPDGKKFIAADYAQIEARLVFWFANEQKALDIFRRKEDVYCDMASDIYKRKITKADEAERFMGKQSTLGLGFQMGADKFKSMLYDIYDVKIELSFAKEIVKTYRKKYAKVKKLWGETQEAAINAVLYPGQKYYCARRKICYFVKDDFLHCRLPSGRLLSYHQPKVKEIPNPWGGEVFIKQLSFMGNNSYTRKWERQTTYGGSLVENYVQASSADITAHGMLNGEKKGYVSIFTVHDESIAMVPEDFGSYQEYEQILCDLPEWAKTIPVEAEGWEGKRFRK